MLLECPPWHCRPPRRRLRLPWHAGRDRRRWRGFRVGAIPYSVGGSFGVWVTVIGVIFVVSVLCSEKISLAFCPNGPRGCYRRRQIVLHRYDERGSHDWAEDSGHTAWENDQHDLARHRPVNVGERGELKNDRLGRSSRAGERRGQDAAGPLLTKLFAGVPVGRGALPPAVKFPGLRWDVWRKPSLRSYPAVADEAGGMCRSGAWSERDCGLLPATDIPNRLNVNDPRFVTHL